MLIRLVPLVAGLLPIIAIHASYVIAMYAGTVSRCIPYIGGCASISATGRHPPASFLFKGAMMPDAIVLAAFWLLSVAWLRALARSYGRPADGGRLIAVLGVAGALFMIVYVTFLGTPGPFYQFMRRFGVYFYFLFTIVAQIMLARAVLRLPVSEPLQRIVRVQLWLALLPFAMGVLNTTLKATLADPDPAENIIEWTVSLLMQMYFVLAFFAWRRTGFEASFGVTDPPKTGAGVYRDG